MNQNRPPIVVILGHVDHGKTTLLDYLRKSNVVAREAGGITQSINSFQLTTPNNKLITFIDTPGHAAFTQMRSRGSRVADIAILIVAGNDGVMPQTKESIKFITESGLPYIVAITKSDLTDSNPDTIKTQLTEAGVIVEEFGGNVPSISVSAKTGQGIPELLDLINLMTELDPPQGDPEGELEAIILEAKLDTHKGPLATVIVKNGTLKAGQNLFQSGPVGKVRALLDSSGKNVTQAGPSFPVEILGLSVVPPVGSVISTQPIISDTKASPTVIAEKSSASVNIILKADVIGSLEAILTSLPVHIKVISSATGDVNENDVTLAKTSSAIIVGFNVKIPSQVAKLAEVDKVSINSYRIIYELLENLDKLGPELLTDHILGRAEVIAEFKIGPDRIAGCRCIEGVLTKSDTARIERSSVLVGSTRIKSLHQAKNSIDKIKAGQEFGVVFSPYVDFKIGDSIIAFETIHGTS